MCPVEVGEGDPDPAFLWAAVFQQDSQTLVCQPSRGHSDRVRVLGFSSQIQIWEQAAGDVFAVVTFPRPFPAFALKIELLCGRGSYLGGLPQDVEALGQQTSGQ